MTTDKITHGIECDFCSRTLPALFNTKAEALAAVQKLGWAPVSSEIACKRCLMARGELKAFEYRETCWQVHFHEIDDSARDRFIRIWFAVRVFDGLEVSAMSPLMLLESIKDVVQLEKKQSNVPVFAEVNDGQK